MQASQATTHMDALTAPANSAMQARFWDRMARKYAASAMADPAGYEFTLSRVREHLLPVHDVLELGCGTGTTALRLAQGVRRMVATDVSAQMIAIAQEKLALQPTPQLTFQVADADAQGNLSETFDVVLAFNLLHLVVLPRTLRQVVGALKPGGLFISKTPCVGEMSLLIRKVVLPLMRVVGMAPPVLRLRQQDLMEAIVDAGMEILAMERHASKGRDFRPFIIARKPLNHPVVS